jgi:glycosyltransferase involved in cell wall biosynthesis
MVAHHFPPEGGSSGVLRTLKFSRYLPRYGWEPHILTLVESAYPVRDEALCSQIPPEAVVHRTAGIDTTRHLAIRGRHLSCLAVPDPHIGWLPFAVPRGLGVIRRHGIDAIYSTSPMASAHLVALLLNRATRLPWIADFRDPWIEEGIHPRPGSLRYRVERRLERAVVAGADRLSMTTPQLRDEILGRHPDLEPGKARVIYNGYDESDFAALTPGGDPERFELIHAGLVTPEFRDPSPVFRAVASLVEERSLPREATRLTFLGGGPYVDSAAFRGSVAAHGLSDLVEVAPRVSHAESLQRLAHAGALLLLQASDDTRALIPAKAFEYLRLPRPILALTMEGATADLLRGLDACYVLAPSDAEGLRDAVRAIYARWRAAPEGGGISRPIGRFERSTLAGELAAALLELTPAGHPGSHEH